MSQIADAFRRVAATRQHVGQIVPLADEHATARATRAKPPPLLLHRKGTYIINACYARKSNPAGKGSPGQFPFYPAVRVYGLIWLLHA